MQSLDQESELRIRRNRKRTGSATPLAAVSICNFLTNFTSCQACAKLGLGQQVLEEMRQLIRIALQPHFDYIGTSTTQILFLFTIWKNKTTFF